MLSQKQKQRNGKDNKKKANAANVMSIVSFTRQILDAEMKLSVITSV